MLATEETIKILQELWKYKETDKYTEAEIRQALEMTIKALKQEPKIGHWIDAGEREPWYRCSECRKKVWGGHHKYCPNCGTKMEKEGEV